MTPEEILQEFASAQSLGNPISDLSSDIPRGWHVLSLPTTLSVHERHQYTLSRKGRKQCLRCSNPSAGKARCIACSEKRQRSPRALVQSKSAERRRFTYANPDLKRKYSRIAP
jgi:hypothetical protein